MRARNARRCTDACESACAAPNKRGHAPFRDSNLTKLLQDSLGGRARTLLIACVAPGDKYAEETLRTLKYASRAASIQNTVMTNDSAEAAEIRRLQREVSALRRRLGRSGASGDASALDSGDESGAEAAAGESRLRVRDLYVDPDREDADGDAGGAVPSPRGRAGFALAATNSGLFVSVRGDALSSAGRRARPGADAHRTPTEAAAFSAAGAFADDDPPAARRAATGMLTVAQMRQLLTP